MDKLSCRSLLRALAGGSLSTVGTVILARSSLAALGTPEDTKPGDLDVQARAAELDAGGLGPAGEAHAQFLNSPIGGFGNGFRNGGFGNGGFGQRWLPQRWLPQRWFPQWRRLPQWRFPQRRFPQLVANDFRRPGWPPGTSGYPADAVLELDCLYCYLPDRSNKGKMTLETLEKTFNWVFSSGLVRQPFMLLWHAGEPMVLPASFYEQATLALERCNVSGFEVTQSLQTNATLVNDAWCEFIRRRSIQVGAQRRWTPFP